MPKIYDNIENFLTEGLMDVLNVSKRADFCVGYFNLRGWKEIVEKVDVLEGMNVEEKGVPIRRVCRLLVGMQKKPVDTLVDTFFDDEITIDNAEALRIKKKLAQDFKEQLTIGTPTDKDEKALRQLSLQLKEGKVVVKLYLRHPLHAKLYLAYSDSRITPVLGFLGSSNLTFSGLIKQGELNVDVVEQDSTRKLSDWFDERWNDRWCIDITKELIEIIDTSWASEEILPPYYIYLKMAYHLSREARAGINEFRLPKVFREELLDFQQRAVQVAAHHLNKRGGVMIGDVVGLGKTITATALAKLFEEDFGLETLIICPKNLVNMWEDYVYKYQIHAKIISQSVVQNELVDLRRYRVVIIDESHNLRNDEGRRYRAIKSYIEENDSKVILLSATPYNKSYEDLSNQLRLFISDDMDLGISPERYIESIGGAIQFNARHTETHIRSIKAFEKSAYSDDWRELMKLYLVRRTRGFIKNNYASLDAVKDRKYLEFADGTRSYFPDRIVKKVEYQFDESDKDDQYAKLYSDFVVGVIENLELPRYGLKIYLNPTKKPTKDEENTIQNLSRAGQRLIGFCRTNLFKRLESSGFSFLQSLCRHVLRNFIFIYALERGLPIPIGKQSLNLYDDYFDEDIEKDVEDDSIKVFAIDEGSYFEQAKRTYKVLESAYKTRFSWIRSEMFKKELLDSLITDSRRILDIIEISREWNPHKDRQLNALFELITEKHSNEKVLIFTQFADTAYYLYEQIVKKGVNDVGCVTGDVENPTSFAYRFSPISNKKQDYAKEQGELRVLITTDVLSEGQNLQDAHIILNFDLPWAIIRLIQRAGRVDRIGQKASEIYCYSFLPEDGIERIISLRNRLVNRIKQNAEIVGSDEVFFEGDPVNIVDLYSEKSGILDEEDEEVDLASFAYQIWKNAIDEDNKLEKIIPNLPNVVYSTKVANAENFNGVIVYTKTAEDSDVLSLINSDGEVITQSQIRILKEVQCLPDTKPLRKITNHHDLIKTAIDNVLNDEQKLSGTLGKKTGIKYRLYMRLKQFTEEKANSNSITDSLKRAIDDIYKFPFKHAAADSINRQMKSGISDEELAELVAALREEDRLCNVNENETGKKLPQIICSLGIIKS